MVFPGVRGLPDETQGPKILGEESKRGEGRMDKYREERIGGTNSKVRRSTSS